MDQNVLIILCVYLTQADQNTLASIQKSTKFILVQGLYKQHIPVHNLIPNFLHKKMVNICTISIQHTIKQNLRNIRNIFLKGTIRTHNPGFSFFGSKNDPRTGPEEAELLTHNSTIN